jgi:hypothetical protein
MQHHAPSQQQIMNRRSPIQGIQVPTVPMLLLHREAFGRGMFSLFSDLPVAWITVSVADNVIQATTTYLKIF